jgi:uncharacterized membrane protein YdbT with pleckstrin-like domain
VAFPRNLLNDSEQMILDLRPHWLYIVPAAAAFAGAVVLALFGIVLWSTEGTVNTIVNLVCGALVVVTGAWFGWSYAKWVTTMFVLTDSRILTRSGIVSKQGTAIPLERINTVFDSKSVFERIVGAGDLTIESAGSEGNLELHDIRRPDVVKREIYNQMEGVEGRRYERFRGDQAPVDPTTVQGSSIPDQIEQLAELHQRGVLSDSEYARKKAELLDRM